MAQLIIDAALTGMVPATAHNADVPVTIEEIAADARRCVDAGAAILHLHVRYPDGRRPAYERETNAAQFTAVRTVCPDVIISGSTSGRVVSDLDKRAAVLDAAPDMASLLGLPVPQPA